MDHVTAISNQGDNDRKRYEIIKSNIDSFAGKSLIDIGCASGYFAQRFILDGGASVVGIEPDYYYRQDCNNLSLPSFKVLDRMELVSENFDICFYLSLHYHSGINYLPWCKEHARVLFIETSGSPEASRSNNVRLLNDLLAIYKNVKDLGTTDYAARTIYKCY